MELRFYMGKKYTVTEIVGNVSVACIHQYALALPFIFLRLEVFLRPLRLDSCHALGHGRAGSADGVGHVKVLQQLGGHVQWGLGVQRLGCLACCYCQLGGL